MIVKVTVLPRNLGWGAKDQATQKVKTKYDGCIDKWVPGLNKMNGLVRTGLTTESALEFEKKLQLPEGSLSPTGSYWDNFSIIIPEKGLIIDTLNPVHDLWRIVMSADPTVAKSTQEAATIASCEYLMTSETAVALEKNTARDIKTKAFVKFDGLTQIDVVDTLYLLGKYADDTDPEIARNMLGDIVELKPQAFMAVVNDPSFKEKVFVLKCIRKGIIKKQTGGKGSDQPLWYDDTLLGKGLDDVVMFLKTPENQNVYIALKKALIPTK